MRRGVKTRLLHQVKDSGKRAWKSSVLRGEFMGKEGDGSSGQLPARKCRYKSGH